MYNKFQYRKITPSAIYSILFRKNGQTFILMKIMHTCLSFLMRKNYMHNYAVMNIYTCLHVNSLKTLKCVTLRMLLSGCIRASLIQDVLLM